MQFSIILTSLLFFVTALSAELPSIFPPALQKGDLIALLFPASFLEASNEEAKIIMDRKAAWLQQKGYRTVFYPHQVNRNGYLAGTDAERAAALMQAWRNDQVKAIWCFRGGYGTPRILNYLDYDTIKTHPKILIGMSDITALHQAIQQKTGLVTFLAPVLNYFDGKNNDFDDQYAFSSLEKVVCQGENGVIPLPSNMKVEVINPGKAQGKLVGGNLTMIASLCGTYWQLNTEGKVLLLEDVSEDVYRIDRLLWQLQEANLLLRPAAVILSSWTDCKTNSPYALTLDQVFAHYFKGVDYPVIKNFPSGHTKYQATLPLNALIEVNADSKTVSILESTVFHN